ncbi:DUF6236 family protein [Pseudomonas sp. NPDC090201]|uniref:DUF6236 family protein n=1 Tax=Pseudomonas sp. NPDC090201 TaxID=3364475 RepID=UPI0038303309
MGEAKWRKKYDPDFGKPKPKMRGVIITPPSHVDGKGISFRSSTLDKGDLRASLFYWDRLIWPTNNLIHNRSDADAKFLEASGIMDRPSFNLYGNFADAAITTQMMALESAEADQPGMWSLAGGVNSLTVAGHLLEQSEGTRIELINAIPLPSSEVPLAEILEFKAKRRSELIAFRTHLEAMTQEISASIDSADTLKQKLKELDLACVDLFKTTKESQIPIYLSDLKVDMNTDFAKAIEVGSKAWKNLDSIGLSETEKMVGTIAAGFSSLIKINPQFKFKGIKRPTSPYKYLYQAQKELF